MIFGSVCSGIEAATQAWGPLGWSPAFYSEIEKFPSAVLAHHYGSNMPDQPWSENATPNYGDMTKFEGWPDHGPFSERPIDVLCGGTPCQSFSIAGLRKGLDDQRGNLSLTFGAIARRYRPTWLVWENVPGVLSSNRGRDFASILGLLSGRKITSPADGWKNAGYVESIPNAYGLAWRVLDAQHIRVDGFERAVPQRRRRVVLVGYSGDWRRAAAVLFERESLSGNPAPRRQTGQSFTHDATPSLTNSGRGVERAGDTRGQDAVIAAEVASTLYAAFGDKLGLENQHVNSGCPLFVTHSLRGEGFDASEDGTGRGTPLVPVAFNSREDPEVTYDRSGPDGVGVRSDGAAYTLEARQVPQAVAFAQNTRDEVRLFGGDGGITGALAAEAGMKQTTYVAEPMHPSIGWSEELTPSIELAGTIQRGGDGGRHDGVFHNWAVRRLTPVECERLMGFPDNFTQIPWRGKDPKKCPDGPRYKALGNSWAVNMFAWVGQRINTVQQLIDEGTI